MARTKIPDNETIEETENREIFETLSNFANRSEKTSWKRKRDNIEALIERLKPLEQRILNIMEEKLPILDEIATIRNEMVENCIHPIDQLVRFDDHVVCKFCERKLSIPKVDNDN